jgi:hypothetical protein
MQTETETIKKTAGKKEKKVQKSSKDVEQVSNNTNVQLENKNTTTPPPVVVQEEEKKPVDNTVVIQLEKSNEDSIVLQDLDVNIILEYLNTSSDRLLEYAKFFKDNAMTKDERIKVETGFKKFFKATSTLQNGYYEYLSKQVNVLEKNSGNKNGVKKVTDKEKSAIHKKLPVQPFLLSFMKLPSDTLVSRSDALTAITNFVKDEKIKNPSIIVTDDKRSFHIIGDLKVLFNGIEKIMRSKNLIDEKQQIPTQIKYTQIMQYMTHCFIKDTTVV